jgi:integrase
MVCPDRSMRARVFHGYIGNLYWRHLHVLEEMNRVRKADGRDEVAIFKAHGLRSVFSSVMEARGMATPTKNYYMGHAPEGHVDDIHYERPTTESLAMGAQVLTGK